MRSWGCKLDFVEVSDGIGMGFDDGVVCGGVSLKLSIDLGRQESLNEESLFTQAIVSLINR